MVAIKENLRHAIQAGRLAQAYILVGAVYDEGREFAEWLGAQLLGESDSIEQHSNPNMPWFEPEKKSRIIDIKMMAERILPFAQQSTLAGGWKVPVIVSADRFHVTAANAFLKTLEEPPERTLFLLLVDNLSDMLPTIISRCQVVFVGGPRILKEPWRGQLLSDLCAMTEKTVLSATLLSEQICALLGEMEQEATTEITALVKKNATHLNEEGDQVKAMISARVKKWRGDLFFMLEQWMEDLIRLRSVPADVEVPLTFSDQREVLKQRANSYSLAKLLENQEMMATCLEQLDRNLPLAQILPYWMDRFYL